MTTKPVVLGVLLVLLFCAVPAHAHAASTDYEDHAAADAIDRAMVLGFFARSASFSPDAGMTRGALAIVLSNYAGEELPEANASLTDVPADSAAARPAAWAVAHGIMSKTGSCTFSPNQIITREEFAAALVRLSDRMQVALPHVRGRSAIFTDLAQCSDDTLDAVYTLYRAGVIGSDGAVYPKDPLTRAECAILLCRYVDAINRDSESEEGVLISHMGYWEDAPENTLPAFMMARQMKYFYAETDVQFSADNVPVLSHDATIDRTSNGSGSIADMTLEKLQTFDFSKDSAYSGVRITTFEQFIRFCSKNYIHPVVEIKRKATDEQLETLFSIVRKYQMSTHVTWISFNYSTLERIRDLYPDAELSYLVMEASDKAISRTAALKTDQNAVYLSCNYKGISNRQRAKCIRSRVYLQIWTIDDKQIAVEQLNTCAVGITVDRLTRRDLFSSAAS